MSQIRRRMAETMNNVADPPSYGGNHETRLTQPIRAAQPSNEIQSTNYYVRNYKRFMQNKPNLVRRRRIANELKVL